VSISVLHDGARDLLGLVAEGTADFAITPLTRRTTPALLFDPLLSTPLVLICPPAHRLAGARGVDLADVVDEPLIDLPRGWWVRELLDRMFAERGLPRRVRLEVDEWFGVLTMVRRGLGIACGPLACIDEVLVGDVAVATLESAPTWELGIATRDAALRGAAGRAFLDAYRRQCGERLGGSSAAPASCRPSPAPIGPIDIARRRRVNPPSGDRYSTAPPACTPRLPGARGGVVVEGLLSGPQRSWRYPVMRTPCLAPPSDEALSRRTVVVTSAPDPMPSESGVSAATMSSSSS
jgi:hypothetical protein